jgi:hypothetical protein
VFNFFRKAVNQKLEQILRNQDLMLQNDRKIMAKQAEIVEQLKGVLAQQKKTSAEITTLQGSVDVLKAKIVQLEEAVANGEVGQALVDIVAEVKTQAQLVDDQIPDVATT